MIKTLLEAQKWTNIINLHKLLKNQTYNYLNSANKKGIYWKHYRHTPVLKVNSLDSRYKNHSYNITTRRLRTSITSSTNVAMQHECCKKLVNVAVKQVILCVETKLQLLDVVVVVALNQVSMNNINKYEIHKLFISFYVA